MTPEDIIDLARKKWPKATKFRFEDVQEQWEASAESWTVRFKAKQMQLVVWDDDGWPLAIVPAPSLDALHQKLSEHKEQTDA